MFLRRLISCKNFRVLYCKSRVIVPEIVDEVDEPLLLFQYLLPVLSYLLLPIYMAQLKQLLLFEYPTVGLAQLVELLLVLAVFSLVLFDHSLLKLLNLSDPHAVPHSDLAYFLFEKALLVVVLLELSSKVILDLLVHEEFLF